MFRNYWVAKSGRDAAKLDWEATWHNWVLKEPAMRINGDKGAPLWKSSDATIMAKATELGINTKGASRSELISRIEEKIHAH